MFPKSATAFKVTNPEALLALTEEKLADYSFEPCGPGEALKQGFSEVHGQYAYSYHGFMLLNLTIQKKSVPASAIKIRLKELCDALEETQGHQPGKKQRKELKERIVDEMLPRAIPTTKTEQILIDINKGIVIVGNTSNALHTVIAGLFHQIGEIGLAHLKMPASATMTKWLVEEGPGDEGEGNLPSELTADDTVVFEHPGEKGKTVKYERTNLNDEDVLANLNAGAVVLSMALTYDSRISFVLKDGSLGRIKVQGVLDEKYVGPDEDRFDAELYLAGVEMSGLFRYLEGVA